MKFCDSCFAKVCVAWFSSCARIPSFRLDSRTLPKSFQSRSWIQDPDPILENRIASPRDPPERFGVRVRATLWNRVTRCCYINSTGSWCLCRFLPRTYISWTVEHVVPKISLTAFAVDDRRSYEDLFSFPDIYLDRYFSWICSTHTYLDLSWSSRYFLVYSYILLYLEHFFYIHLLFFDFFIPPVDDHSCNYFLFFICVYTSYNCFNLSLHTLTYWLNRFTRYSVNRIYFCLPVFWLVYRLLSRHFLCTANYFVNPSTIPSVGRMRSRIST